MSRIRDLIVTVLIAVSFVFGQTLPSGNSEGITKVEYCELVRHPDLYAGKTIRVGASWLTTFEWSTLYDMDCNSRDLIVEAILDCTNMTLCEEQKKRGFATDKTGNVFDGTRAEFVLVGRFKDNREHYDPQMNGSCPFALHIRSIEKYKAVPFGTPWPGEQRVNQTP